MTSIEQLRKQLIKLMCEQVKYFRFTPKWMQLEAEIDLVNDQLNEMLNK